VRARIAFLRAQTKDATTAKTYDFEKRLTEVREKEAALRAEKKAARKAVKDQARVELVKDVEMTGEEDDMSKMMGFSGFGSSKK
jgi:U4/U6.U5 tri-snRNP component SNU23